MIISAVRRTSGEGIVRLEATVTWEDVDAEPIDLFLETEERVAEAVLPDPGVFLAACLLPAWSRGERRVRVSGPVCPVLAERSRTAVGMARRWYPDGAHDAPVLELPDGLQARAPVDGQTVAMLSCGIDSLATLRWNTLHIPRDHPDAIRLCVHFTYDDDPAPSARRLAEVTAPRRPAIEAVTADAGVDAVALRTNLWWLMDDGYFFTSTWHGACLAAMLTAFAGGYRRGCIASSHNPEVVEPYGSHPLLDESFTSAHFRVDHDLFSMGRSEKLALVAGWPAGTANVRVCQNDVRGADNCGTCEKCIRTQVQFAALGRLDVARPAFPYTELTPELVATIDEYDMIRGHPYYISWYGAAVPMLRDRGYGDVADVLARVVRSAAGSA